MVIFPPFMIFSFYKMVINFIAMKYIYSYSYIYIITIGTTKVRMKKGKQLS
jgi:hypothetical protein